MPDSLTHGALPDPTPGGAAGIALRPSPPPARAWTYPLLLGALVSGATWVSIALTRIEAGVATLWIANGMLVTALLLSPRAHWLRFALAAAFGMIFVRWGYGDTQVEVFGLSAANLLEAWIITLGIRRGIPDLRDPAQLKPLARAALLWTLLACAGSATLAALLLALFADAPAHVVWITWFGAHVLGMVLVATLGVSARQLGWRLLGRRGRHFDYAACLGLLVAVCLVVGLQGLMPLLFLTYLPLVLFTFRHGIAGVVVGTILLALAGSIYAGLGAGPFALVGDASVGVRTLLLQLYVGGGCLLAYPIAVALAERRRLAAQVRASEARYRLLAEHSRDLIVRMDIDRRRVYVSPSSTALLGWTPEELAAPRRELLHPDDRPRLEAELDRLFAQGGSAVLTYRFLHKAGYYVWLEANLQRVDAVDPAEIVYSARDVTARVYAEEAMQESQNQLRDAAQELERLARFDALTGLANRRHFDQSLAEATARAQRAGAPLVLLALDLDRFKQINDTLGHAAGDQVLQATAARLRECVYEVDLAARLGGDEFVVLIEYSPTAEVGSAVAQRIVEAMRAPLELDGAPLPLSVSIGVGVHFPVRSAQALLELADQALYDAKRAGRDGWAVREG
jgi:diguanylate cyclase (GGDEF)-like protein/PAS domain S-box-containing protein